MDYSISVEFRFEAAHRLMEHEGKCRHLHGHSYRAIVTIRGSTLGDTGMVMDFGDLKGTLGRWIDDYLDHNILLQHGDPLLSFYFDPGNTVVRQDQVEMSQSIFGGKQPFVSMNPPTAEVLARIIFSVAVKFLPDGVSVESVNVFETEKCSATCRS